MRQFRVLEKINLVAEKMMRLLPDWMTGKQDVLYKKYRIRYGNEDYKKLVYDKKLRTMKTYLILCSIFLVIGIISLPAALVGKNEITKIQKPEYGSKEASVPVQVQINYKDYTVVKDVEISAGARELTEKEKEVLIQNYKNKLPEIILDKNPDFKHVSEPLNLIERDAASGITINWISMEPDLISEKGEVFFLTAEENQTVELIAELTLDEVTITEKYQVQIDKNASEEDYERNLTDILNKALARIEEADTSSKIILPDKLGEGISVNWSNRKDNNSTLLFISFLFALLIVYFKRYDQINKEIRDAEESITKDLPEFINKLVLLLNAGLVVSTAFSKIVEDYQKFNGSNKKDSKQTRYLYDELYQIQRRVNQSNTSLIKELKEFSLRCGVREMVRVTAVISDNWSKGSMLAEKLESESELLWLNRKKSAEEKGRLAETKLTLPLMILLIVLIMITIAPALMEM